MGLNCQNHIYIYNVHEIKVSIKMLKPIHIVRKSNPSSKSYHQSIKIETTCIKNLGSSTIPNRCHNFIKTISIYIYIGTEFIKTCIKIREPMSNVIGSPSLQGMCPRPSWVNSPWTCPRHSPTLGADRARTHGVEWGHEPTRMDLAVYPPRLPLRSCPVYHAPR